MKRAELAEFCLQALLVWVRVCHAVADGLQSLIIACILRYSPVCLAPVLFANLLSGFQEIELPHSPRYLCVGAQNPWYCAKVSNAENVVYFAKCLIDEKSA
jgi:hypothetical protein